MRVRAILRGQRILVQPDPVQVLVGEPLYWEFVSALPNQRIKWDVYFQKGAPFGQALNNLTAETALAPDESVERSGPFPNPTHYGLSPSVVPTTPGEYKYGVRAQDVRTQHMLADDDPLLIVLP